MFLQDGCRRHGALRPLDRFRLPAVDVDQGPVDETARGAHQISDQFCDLLRFTHARDTGRLYKLPFGCKQIRGTCETFAEPVCPDGARIDGIHLDAVKMIAGNEVDDARHRVRPIDRGRAVGENLDPL